MISLYQRQEIQFQNTDPWNQVFPFDCKCSYLSDVNKLKTWFVMNCKIELYQVVCDADSCIFMFILSYMPTNYCGLSNLSCYVEIGE